MPLSEDPALHGDPGSDPASPSHHPDEPDFDIAAPPHRIRPATAPATPGKLEHFPDQNRYLFWWHGARVGLTDYRLRGQSLHITHTEIDPRRRGEGLGEAMVAAVVIDIAQTTGYRIIPDCPFVDFWLSSHPEYQNLRFR